jgi:hypothetical protein
MMVDPLTHLWQGQLREEDAWAKLPFGQAEQLEPSHFSDPLARDRLVAAAVDHQLENGATAIIPPYPYVSGPGDPWFHRALQLIRSTAGYMASTGLNMPVVPVLCASAQGLSAGKTWGMGIDRFAQAALNIGPQAIALCFSPMSAGDSYAKVQRVFGCVDHLQRQFGVPVYAWRQGFFGPGLVATGAAGYETGVATSEFCDVAGSIRSRRPPKPGAKRQSGGGSLGIYADPFGRSLPAKVGEALLGDERFRPKIMCDDQRCCPNGVRSTLERRREHAIRTRARALAAIDALPHRTWKLHQVAKDATAAVTLATQANDLLKAAGVEQSIKTPGYEAVAQVANHLRATDVDAEAA